tara:strand:- start:670 stop:1815 length:1146 start_codon:yes stop_codon:yes gene_type:complete
MRGTTYKDAGVDVGLGNDASKILYNASQLTWENRKDQLGKLIVPFDDFSGIRYIKVSDLPEGTVMNMGFDGVGTKMELAERINDHTTIANDLFAMVCDDAIVRGAEPVLIGSILDVNSLRGNIKQVRQLAEGYVSAAKDAGVAVVNGEIAELPGKINGFGDFNYNWGAGVVWFANEKRLFTGMEIKEGDSLVGLREEGFRSNGLSLVRKIMKENYGEDWHLSNKKGEDGLYRTIERAILTPSKIYSKAVVDMFGGWDLKREPKVEVHGIAHITGGGIPEKVGRMLKPSGLGAMIDKPFKLSMIMMYTQILGKVSDKEAYKTWNMGQGMVIASPNPEGVINVAKSHGIKAKTIGVITKDSKIRIKNMGIYSKNQEMLTFNIE